MLRLVNGSKARFMI